MMKTLLRNVEQSNCHKIMRTLYLNVPSMFETPIFYVMRRLFTDYTNIGKTFPLNFSTSYDNFIFGLCKHLKRPGFLMFEEHVFSVMWMLQEHPNLTFS